MTTRPGRESDFTHLETFVWQAIFPAFDVPGLTEEQRRENDLMVEQARAAVLEALQQPEYTVFTAWDERRRALAGYLILEGNPGEYSTIAQLIVRRSEWGKGVGEQLLQEAVKEVGAYQGIQLAVRAYNTRAIAFFAKHGFVDTGESAGDYAIDRILMIKETDAPRPPSVAQLRSSDEEPVVTSEADPDFTFPTEADAPYDQPLPDHSLTMEESEPIFDPADSYLDANQRSELDAFIAMAKKKKQQKKTVGGTDLFSEPAPNPAPGPPRHPEIEFEIDYGEVPARRPSLAELDSSAEEEKDALENAVEPPRPTSEAAQRAADEEAGFGFEFAFGPATSAAPAAPPDVTLVPELHCPNCGAIVPEGARFCPNCGHRLEDEPVLELEDIEAQEPVVTDAPPPRELTLEDVRSMFEDLLGERLTAYFGADRLPDYLALYRRDETFRQIRDVSLKSLAAYLNQALQPGRAKRRRDDVLAGLVEYFVVETTSELHPGRLPQRLLRYQSVDWTRVDLFRLVMDYLDLDHETETVYTDFITTPAKVLRQATQSYLRAGRDERLLLICDQSLLGSGKHGFAFTDSAVYWKNVLQPAGLATYTTRSMVVVQEGHLLVDGQYFDAGGRLNLRVAVLLDKLRRLDLRGE